MEQKIKNKQNSINDGESNTEDVADDKSRKYDIENMSQIDEQNEGEDMEQISP